MRALSAGDMRRLRPIDGGADEYHAVARFPQSRRGRSDRRSAAPTVPGRARRRAVWPEVSGNERPTYLHPAVVTASVGGYAWMLLVFWVVFCGYGYMGFTMVIATLISGVMFALLIGCGAGGRNMAPWQRPWRSFREFLASDIEIWGGHIRGRDAFIQLAGMSWCLAGLATAFGVIIALSRP